MLKDTAKIEKIDKDIAAVKAKIAEQQNKLRDLEQAREKSENAQIVAIVREIDMSPEDLLKLIDEHKAQSKMKINEGANLAFGKEQADDEI